MQQCRFSGSEIAIFPVPEDSIERLSPISSNSSDELEEELENIQKLIKSNEQ